MKLIAHNLLQCNVSSCKINKFPLKIIATEVNDTHEEEEGEAAERRADSATSSAQKQRETESIDEGADGDSGTETHEGPNLDFVRSVIRKLDWPGLQKGATDLGVAIPQSLPEDWAENDAFLLNLHRVLLELEVVEGHLVCNNCGRNFPIIGGIPNMLLAENE